RAPSSRWPAPLGSSASPGTALRGGFSRRTSMPRSSPATSPPQASRSPGASRTRRTSGTHARVCVCKIP
ncbi:hypothetical protein M885DRAFT_518211, partial [Pelagophyceae sp. CCMP2097]